MDIERALSLAKQLSEYQKTHKLEFFKPYDFQKKFMEAPYDHRLLMAANQIGKTISGGVETAYHATGLYPEWWKGKRFVKPVVIWTGGQKNEKVRDHIQRDLLGPPDDPTEWGTGWIPKSCVGKTTRKAGIPNALASVSVKHITGNFSRIMFKTYEEDIESWMGERIDLAWLDEEPTQEIFTQCVIRTMNQHGIIYITATPESGVTELITQLWKNPKPNQFTMIAGWDDAPHITSEMKEKSLAAIPLHERDMRSKGIPTLGSGQVFPVQDDRIAIQPFDIPKHWPRIVGMDFGWEHKTAVVWVAWDRDTDTAYVYDCYSASKQLTAIHAQAIKSKGQWIPVVWPHDGLVHDKGSGIVLADQYRDLGVNMRREKFSNPPPDGKREGEGGNSVEPGVMSMMERMETGRLKVFSNLSEWFQEKAIYHRKEGLIVKLNDDIMSATRYALMSLRHAQINNAVIKKPTYVAGVSNWKR